MKNFTVTILLISCLVTISSCASKSKLDKAYYSQKSPRIDFKDQFNGSLDGYGIEEDNKGRIARTFSVKIKGEWEENKGIIKEYFVYDDNNKDSIIWIVTINQDGSISAIANDVTKPMRGMQYGNAIELAYSLNKRINGKDTKINVYDNLFAINKDSFVKISRTNNLKTTTFYKKVATRQESTPKNLDVAPKIIESAPKLIQSTSEEIILK